MTAIWAALRRCNRAGGQYSPRNFEGISWQRGREPAAPQGEGERMITPAYAQGAGGFSLEQFGGLGGLLPFVLIFVIMYFLILRPQQKRAKQHQEMVKNVRRGDTLITSGGLVGKVTKVVDDDQVEIEIADGVRVRQVRSMVADVRAKSEPVKDDKSAAS
jgi:preprotein translocase subunit YajC